MQSVKITSYQFLMIMVGFIIGSSTIFFPAAKSSQDVWIVLLFAIAGGLLLGIMYNKIMQLNPEKTLILILKDLFGGVIGTIIGVFYLWYFLHLLSLVLRNFTSFMVTTLYFNTPIVFIAIVSMLVVVYAIKKGLKIIARVSEIIVPILLISLMALFILLISEFDYTNLLPVFENGIKPIIKESFGILTFPFGEIIVFLMILPQLKNNKKSLKIILSSIIISGLLLLLIHVRNLLVLGPQLIVKTTFPSYMAVKMVPGIEIEAVIAINFLIGGSVKIFACLYALSLGYAQIFNVKDYKVFVTPLAAIAVTLSMWIFEGVMQLKTWGDKVYPYYAIIFQLIIPFVILIFSLVKNKKKQKQ